MKSHPMASLFAAVRHTAMTIPPVSSRRAFLTSAMAASVAAASVPCFAAEKRHRFPIVAFSKPFQSLNHEACADFVTEIGWDGIEPETAADELPALVEALKRRGKTVEIGTTNITSIDTPHAEKVLRALAASGVKRYRMGYWKYSEKLSIEKQHAEIRAQIKDLAAMNVELGLRGGYQNHSGSQYVGAPIWDMHGILAGMDSARVGMIFDIGHATVEGGYSWEIDARLAGSRLTAVYVKDFQWERTAKGWKAQWKPLGEGMVNAKYFKMLKATDYAGPISQHHEYELGSREEMIGAMRADLKVLKGWLA